MKIRIVSLQFDANIALDKPVDLDKGTNSFTLAVFKTSGLIQTQIGLSDFKAGDCILLDPTFPHYIKCKNENIIYDSVSFKGSDASRLVGQIGLDLNVIHSPLQIFFIDSILEKISKECRATELLWERVIAACMDELLSKIYRFSKQDFVISMPDHSQKLRDLRTEVHESFSKPWTIGQMASMMGLSASRFASLYKKEFNTSPTEDLIRTRIDQAKRMLSTTKVSVKQVSIACGFESVHYFHRAFKKRNNITPKHFQNHKLSQKGSIPTEEKTFSLDGLSLSSEFLGTIEVIDGELYFHSSDLSWHKLLGYDQNEINNIPFLNFVSPSFIDIARETVTNITKGKNIQDITLEFVSKSEEFISLELSVILKGKTIFWFAKRANVSDLS